MGIFMQKKSIQLLAIILLTYVFMKYISPFASPFAAAFLIVYMMNPFLERIHRKTHFKKQFLAGVLLSVWTILFLLLIWILSVIVIDGGSRMLREVPQYLTNWSTVLGSCCSGLEECLGINDGEIENFMIRQINLFTESFQVNLLPSVMGKSFNYVKSVISFFSFVVVMMIGVLLLSKDYNQIADKFRKNEKSKAIRDIFHKVILYIQTFVRAQFMILIMISTLCALTLTIIGMKNGILYGILTGLMDMLPFVGTGIMLLPLSIFYLVSKEYVKAVVCIALYALCAFLREILEPRLIGNKIGIWPVGILFAVFAGLYLFGVSGIIKGPLSLVIICETVRYLWYTEEKKESGSTKEHE